MISVAKTLTLASVVAFLLAGCRSESGNGLPPQAGSGAAPAPAIPKLADLASAEALVDKPASASAWTGTLVARDVAELGPKMTGILSQITVGEGDRVKKGQLLFRLDSAQASLAVSQANAALASAQIAYEATKLDFARASELIKGGSIAPASFDQSKAAHDRALSGVEQAKVALRVAEHSASDTVVNSPIDGVVTAKKKSVGETVTMMPPTIVLVVQDVDKLELRAQLPEGAISRIEAGKAIHFSARSAGVARDAVVKRVNPTIDARTRTVEVVADVDNADGKLKVGMLVEVALGAGAENAPQTNPVQKIAGHAGPETKAP